MEINGFYNTDISLANDTILLKNYPIIFKCFNNILPLK